MEKVKCPNCETENSTNSKYCFRCGHEMPKIKQETESLSATQTPTPTHTNRTKIIGAVAGALAFALTYFAVQQFLLKPASFDKVMMQVASELNKTTPIMVDRETRLDNAVALPENMFQYNYTLINLEKSEVNIDTVKKYVEPPIINNVKTSPEMKIFRDNKTTLVYNYRDKNGVFVHQVSVTPEMYE